MIEIWRVFPLDSDYEASSSGTFEDTDESGCIFNMTVSENSTIIEWDAGSNQYASWKAQTVICAKQL